MNVKYLLTAASVMAAMPAMAQIPVTASTNLTISGLLAVGVKSSQVSQGNAAADRGLAPELGVYDNTSRLIIASTSEIQPGWNVIFRLENRFTANARPGDVLLPTQGATTTTKTGTSNTTGAATSVSAYNLTVSQATGWADGDTWGGISTPYGNLYAGKSTLYYTDTISAGYLAPSLEQPGESYRIWDCNGLATFNLLSSLNTGSASSSGVFTPSAFYNILGNGRSRNVVRYDTPTYKLDAESLLTASVAWSKNPTAAQNAAPTVAASNATTGSPYQGLGSYYENGSAYYLKGLYNGHGFSASVSYLDDKFEGVLPTAANTELKAIRLGVSYKWQGLKVGVVMDNADMVNGITVAGTPTSFADAKRTTIEVPISYSFDKHAVYVTYTTAGNNNGYANTGAKQLNVGYDYALTKRAFVGVMYTSINNDSNAMYEGFLTGYSPFGGSNVAKMGESFKQISLLLNYWF
jgi:hypothetical protein